MKWNAIVKPPGDVCCGELRGFVAGRGRRIKRPVCGEEETQPDS